ncbi:PH domain-containing protein [Anaeromyxobacter sp. Red801]|uniref:PH domain-containing protein n=1 Tax=Anaeromyxobacter sp. Red801 TaxID=3411632 RepID=UPI003BA372AB
MRESLIAFAVLAVLMFAAQAVRARGRRRPAAPAHVPWKPGQRLVLRTPPRNAFLSCVTALVPAALVAALMIRSWAAEPRRVGPLGMAGGAAVVLLLLAVAAFQLASAARAHVVVHDTGLERVGVFRRLLVGWGSVTKLSFNGAQRWFHLTTEHGAHVWLPLDVAGMPEFARLALRRLPRQVLEADPAAREALQELVGTGGARRSRSAM